MPTEYRIEPALQLVRTRAFGVLSEADSLEHYGQIQADPGFEPTFRQLCDLTDVTELHASQAFIRDLACMTVFAPGTRRAFVAPQPLYYGLTRMLQAFAELEGSTIGVFRSLREAEEWLDLPGADDAEVPGPHGPRRVG